MIKTSFIVEKRINCNVTINLPYWIELILKGQKINAIKELRDIAGENHEDKSLSLKHAKLIVETISNNIESTVISDPY